MLKVIWLPAGGKLKLEAETLAIHAFQWLKHPLFPNAEKFSERIFTLYNVTAPLTFGIPPNKELVTNVFIPGLVDALAYIHDMNCVLGCLTPDTVGFNEHQAYIIGAVK